MFVDSPWPFTSTINHILTKKTEFQFFSQNVLETNQGIAAIYGPLAVK